MLDDEIAFIHTAETFLLQLVLKGNIENLACFLIKIKESNYNIYLKDLFVFSFRSIIMLGKKRDLKTIFNLYYAMHGASGNHSKSIKEIILFNNGNCNKLNGIESLKSSNKKINPKNIFKRKGMVKFFIKNFNYCVSDYQRIIILCACNGDSDVLKFILKSSPYGFENYDIRKILNSGGNINRKNLIVILKEAIKHGIYSSNKRNISDFFNSAVLNDNDDVASSIIKLKPFTNDDVGVVIRLLTAGKYNLLNVFLSSISMKLINGG